MTPPGPSRRLETFVATLLLLLAAVYTFDHDAWTPDEPRVIELARTIGEPSWAFPHLAGKPFLEQPPLYYVAVGLAYRAFGVDPVVARGVSSLFGLAAVAGIGLATARLATRRAGLLAALIAGLTVQLFTVQHRIVVDSALAACVAWSAWAAVRGLSTEGTLARIGFMVVCYAFASLAYLSKGVVGIGLSGFAFVGVVAARRDPRLLLRAHLWAAPIVFLALTAPYHLALYRELGPDGLHEVVVANTVGRAFGKAIGATDFRSHSGKHPLYYLQESPGAFFPGSLLLALAALDRVRRRGKLEPRERVAYDAPLVWLGLGLAFLSVAKTKRTLYLAPLVAPVAAVAGVWLDLALAGRSETRAAEVWLSRGPALLLAVAGLALPIGVAVAVPGSSLALAVVGGLVLLAVGGLSLRASARGNLGKALALGAGGAVLALALACPVLVGALEPGKSYGAFFRKLDAAYPAGAPLTLLFPTESEIGAASFYTRRPVVVVFSADELRAHARATGEVYFYVNWRDGSKGLGPLVDLGAELLLEERRDDGTKPESLALIRIPRAR